MGLSISDRSESSNKLAKMISGIKVANLRDVYKNCESSVDRSRNIASNVTMAKIVRTNKLPSSPPPPAPDTVFPYSGQPLRAPLNVKDGGRFVVVVCKV